MQGNSPLQFFTLMWTGGFGSSFSLQNSLQRATPLLLTALCVAIPARLGLVVIGGEGALVLGGLMAAAVAVPLLGLPAPVVWLAMGARRRPGRGDLHRPGRRAARTIAASTRPSPACWSPTSRSRS